MEYVIGFVLGMVSALLIVRWLAQRAIEKFAEVLAKEVAADSSDKRIKLKVEEDNKTYFMYNATDGAFVCQGVSIQEIRERFQKLYPGYQAEIVGDSELLSKLKTEIEAINENSNSVGRTS